MEIDAQAFQVYLQLLSYSAPQIPLSINAASLDLLQQFSLHNLHKVNEIVNRPDVGLPGNTSPSYHSFHLYTILLSHFDRAVLRATSNSFQDKTPSNIEVKKDCDVVKFAASVADYFDYSSFLTIQQEIIGKHLFMPPYIIETFSQQQLVIGSIGYTKKSLYPHIFSRALILMILFAEIKNQSSIFHGYTFNSKEQAQLKLTIPGTFQQITDAFRVETSYSCIATIFSIVRISSGCSRKYKNNLQEYAIIKVLDTFVNTLVTIHFEKLEIPSSLILLKMSKIDLLGLNPLNVAEPQIELRVTIDKGRHIQSMTEDMSSATRFVNSDIYYCLPVGADIVEISFWTVGQTKSFVGRTEIAIPPQGTDLADPGSPRIGGPPARPITWRSDTRRDIKWVDQITPLLPRSSNKHVNGSCHIQMTLITNYQLNKIGPIYEQYLNIPVQVDRAEIIDTFIAKAPLYFLLNPTAELYVANNVNWHMALLVRMLVDFTFVKSHYIVISALLTLCKLNPAIIAAFDDIFITVPLQSPGTDLSLFFDLYARVIEGIVEESPMPPRDKNLYDQINAPDHVFNQVIRASKEFWRAMEEDSSDESLTLHLTESLSYTINTITLLGSYDHPISKAFLHTFAYYSISHIQLITMSEVDAFLDSSAYIHLKKFDTVLNRHGISYNFNQMLSEEAFSLIDKFERKIQDSVEGYFLHVTPRFIKENAMSRHSNAIDTFINDIVFQLSSISMLLTKKIQDYEDIIKRLSEVYSDAFELFCHMLILIYATSLASSETEILSSLRKVPRSELIRIAKSIITTNPVLCDKSMLLRLFTDFVYLCELAYPKLISQFSDLKIFSAELSVDSDNLMKVMGCCIMRRLIYDCASDFLQNFGVQIEIITSKAFIMNNTESDLKFMCYDLCREYPPNPVLDVAQSVLELTATLKATFNEFKQSLSDKSMSNLFDNSYKIVMEELILNLGFMMPSEKFEPTAKVLTLAISAILDQNSSWIEEFIKNTVVVMADYRSGKQMTLSDSSSIIEKFICVERVAVKKSRGSVSM